MKLHPPRSENGSIVVGSEIVHALNPGSSMGQTETSGRIPARSVLPSTTDMKRLRQHFRLVPKRDSYIAVSRAVLVDHFIGAGEGCWPPPTTQAGSRQLANVRNVEA